MNRSYLIFIFFQTQLTIATTRPISRQTTEMMCCGNQIDLCVTVSAWTFQNKICENFQITTELSRTLNATTKWTSALLQRFHSPPRPSSQKSRHRSSIRATNEVRLANSNAYLENCKKTLKPWRFSRKMNDLADSDLIAVTFTRTVDSAVISRRVS